jgi:hypothetical protein
VGVTKKFVQNFYWDISRKEVISETLCVWEDDIEMCHREMAYEDMNWLRIGSIGRLL